MDIFKNSCRVSFRNFSGGSYETFFKLPPRKHTMYFAFLEGYFQKLLRGFFCKIFHRYSEKFFQQFLQKIRNSTFLQDFRNFSKKLEIFPRFGFWICSRRIEFLQSFFQIFFSKNPPKFSLKKRGYFWTTLLVCFQRFLHEIFHPYFFSENPY